MRSRAGIREYFVSFSLLVTVTLTVSIYWVAFYTLSILLNL